MTSRLKDNLFTEEKGSNRFEFNESVARVFDDMLKRSVPLYNECLEATVQLCLSFVQKNSIVYDLGCSTGTLLKKLAGKIPASVQLIGIDNSEPMLRKAQECLNEYVISKRAKLLLWDLNSDLQFEEASAIIMNYTLHFISPENREALLRRIENSLKPGGILIVIEKVKVENIRLEKVFVNMHHEFKHKQGYSRIEISRKKEALENVLIPLDERDNLAMLRSSGFAEVNIFFRWFNFVGFVALKKEKEESVVPSETD